MGWYPTTVGKHFLLWLLAVTSNEANILQLKMGRQTTLVWRLSCSFKWSNPFLTGWMSHNKRGFSRHDKVRNPEYGLLRYSGHASQKNRKKKKRKKKSTSNCRALCVSRTRNKAFWLTCGVKNLVGEKWPIFSPTNNLSD